MRSLLLHAHRDANFESRLQVALDLARAYDAHLTCVQPITFDVVMPGDFYGIYPAELAPVARADAEEFRNEIEPRLAVEQVRWDWVDEFGLPEKRLLHHAALADLAIVGASSPDGPRGPSALAGLLAVHCKAPVLVVPDGAKGLAIDGPAVVAWDGSLESSQALRAALPLLARASKVSLVSVTEPHPEDEPELPALSGAEYLARHGIDCELVELPKGTRKVSEVLREAARARGASYLVMGAYGVPRVVETLFGGVTRSMLRDADVPILLAH